MGRIPDRFIKDLLERTDIVEVIGSRLELKRAGKEFRARSPFTNEKTPSFFVNPSKQMFFDFSSGKNGTVITFLMEYDRLTFVEAVEELARVAGLEVPREGGKTERLVLDGPLDALAAAEKFFRGQLRTSQVAVEYLKTSSNNALTAYPALAVASSETLFWLNARKPYLNFYVSDDPEYGFGFTGFKPAQGNTKIAGQVLFAGAWTFAPRYHQQLYRITG